MPARSHKVCRDRRGRGCGETLPIDRFYTSNGNPVSVCKSCYRDIYSRNRTRRTRPPQGRAFGVELELTGPSGDTIAQALSSAGVNINYHGRYRATNGSQWELKRDGSVSGHGLELVSPKLYGERGLEELQTVCEALRQAGATVNRSCGLHVHHDARDYSARQVAKQVRYFVEREDIIMNMMAPSRRSNRYCSRWGNGYSQQLASITHTEELRSLGPRGTINLHAYPRHGSVEMRSHAGTTNFKKIRAWVRFGQALFAAANADATVRSDTAQNMLADLTPHGLTGEDASWLLRFETAGESRRDVEARVERLRQQVETDESVLEEV